MKKIDDLRDNAMEALEAIGFTKMEKSQALQKVAPKNVVYQLYKDELLLEEVIVKDEHCRARCFGFFVSSNYQTVSFAEIIELGEGY